MSKAPKWIAGLALLSTVSAAAQNKSELQLWVLKPVVRAEMPAGRTKSTDPIDAFLAADYRAKGLHPAGPAGKRILLRRVYLDLIVNPAYAGGAGRFPPGPVAGRLRKSRGPTAGQRAARRALRAALARGSAVRRCG